MTEVMMSYHMICGLDNTVFVPLLQYREKRKMIKYLKMAGKMSEYYMLEPSPIIKLSAASKFRGPVPEKHSISWIWAQPNP